VSALRRASPFAIAEARRLLTELGIEAPDQLDQLDVEDIAAHKGAAVMKRDLAGCDGRLLRSGDDALIVVDSRAYQSAKWRFTIAHELGHLLLHKDIDSLKLCTERDMNDYSGSGREQEANEFAAELLMPKAIFGRCCDEVKRPSMTHVRNLATRFATSLSATALRFVECTAEPCAIVYTEGDRIKWWAKNDGFGLWIERGEKVSQDTYAYDLAHGKHVDDRMQLTDGRAWCDESRADDVKLHEHPMALPTLGAVITLLWHPA
jgi:Zn-dependent peptidase ImmA (M78 family)